MSDGPLRFNPNGYQSPTGMLIKYVEYEKLLTRLTAEEARRQFMQNYGTFVAWGFVGPRGEKRDATDASTTGVVVYTQLHVYDEDTQIGYAYYRDHAGDKLATERAAIDEAMRVMSKVREDECGHPVELIDYKPLNAGETPLLPYCLACSSFVPAVS